MVAVEVLNDEDGSEEVTRQLRQDPGESGETSGGGGECYDPEGRVGWQTAVRAQWP
jgi:hypothetical protein